MNTEKTFRISLSVTSVFSVVKFKSRQLQIPVLPFEIKKLQHRRHLSIGHARSTAGRSSVLAMLYLGPGHLWQP